MAYLRNSSQLLSVSPFSRTLACPPSACDSLNPSPPLPHGVYILYKSSTRAAVLDGRRGRLPPLGSMKGREQPCLSLCFLFCISWTGMEWGGVHPHSPVLFFQSLRFYI